MLHFPNSHDPMITPLWTPVAQVLEKAKLSHQWHTEVLPTTEQDVKGHCRWDLISSLLLE